MVRRESLRRARLDVSMAAIRLVAFENFFVSMKVTGNVQSFQNTAFEFGFFCRFSEMLKKLNK